MVFVLLSTEYLVWGFCPREGKEQSNRIDFSGVLTIHSNGIATVPAFSLGKPALIGTFSLNKKRFGFDQSLAYSIDVSTYHGYGFREGSIRWATFVSIRGNLPKWGMGKSLFTRLYPELLYINLDGRTDAYFVAGEFGIGHRKVPLCLSARISQFMEGNLTPNPVSLKYARPLCHKDIGIIKTQKGPLD